MPSRIDELCEVLAGDGIDVDPGRCDTWFLRHDAHLLAGGDLPMHMDGPPVRPFAEVAADMRELADALDNADAPGAEHAA